MSCQEIRGLLDAYLDNELDLVTASQFEQHLAECSSCRDLYERRRDVHHAVHQHIPYFEAPAKLEESVRANLNPTGRAQAGSPKRNWFSGWQSWAAAASLLLAVALGFLLFIFMRRPSASQLLAEQVVSSHIRSLMASHLNDVASSDQHTVKPWFSGKLDFAPVVKDLSPQGFPLVGGRLDYVDNRPVAALVYTRRQHTINLFLWPSAKRDSPPHRLTIRGYNVIHWTQGRMSYWAVSDLNAQELADFVRHQRR